MAEQKQREASVVRRFLLFVLPALVLILSGIGLGGFLVLRSTVFDTNFELGGAVVYNAMRGMDLWIRDQVHQLRSDSAKLTNPTDAEVLNQLVEDGWFENAYVISGTEVVAEALLGGSRADPRVLSDAATALQRGASTHVGTTYAGADGEPLLPFAASFLDNEGRSFGIVSSVRLRRLTDGFVNQSELGESAYIFIIDSEGQMIAHRNDDLVITENGRETAVPWYESAISGDLQFTRVFGESTNLYVGQEFVLPADDAPVAWYVYYRRDMNESLSVVRELIFEFAAAITTVVVLVSLILFLVSRRVVSKPLRAVRDQLEEIAGGGGDLTQRIDVRSSDEIGGIGDSFNRFLKTLAGIVRRIQKTVELNLQVRDGLSSSSTETSASVNQIIQNIESIETVMQRLDGEVTTASASTEEIQRNIDLLAKEATNQSSAVSQSTASVEQMIASLKSVAGITAQRTAAANDLIAAAEDGGRLLDATTATIAEVTKSISSITEMTGAIEAIASQTNLLSMNAAIEAAHAGDAGRGFAVVAEEIRKLAETASTSSQEIATNVRDIVANIQQSGSDTAQLQEKLTEIITQIREIGAAFAEIEGSTAEMSSGGDEVLSAMKSLSDVSVQISTAADEMKIGATQTNQNMSNATELAGTAHAAVQQVTEGSKEILEAMTRLLELTHELDERTGELEREIGQFVV